MRGHDMTFDLRPHERHALVWVGKRPYERTVYTWLNDGNDADHHGFVARINGDLLMVDHYEGIWSATGEFFWGMEVNITNR